MHIRSRWRSPRRPDRCRLVVSAGRRSVGSHADPGPRPERNLTTSWQRHGSALGWPNVTTKRAFFWGAAAAVVVGLVYLMATASTGPIDPTEATHPQSEATIVFNAAMIVFREGLEAVL